MRSTNVLLGELDTEEKDINKTAQKITDAILKAASQNIPKGSRVKYKPFWNDKLDQAVKAREAAKRRCMENPTSENKIELNRTTAITRKETLAAKREKFQKTCDNIDLSREGNKAWSLLKNLNGEQRKTNPQPISDEGETIADDQKRAERHNKYFASTNKASKLTNEDMHMLKDLKTREKAPRANIKLFDDNFTISELNKAMKKLKSRKSPGPDKIHNEMLTHLGQDAKKVILSFINTTWQAGEVPKLWKIATIKPL